jgi:XRE family transcriptional regulator, regulator of sulfur utilization
VSASPRTSSAQLGAAIRLFRESRAQTIEDLAADAGIHWTYLSGIEHGKRNPSWQVVSGLSEALDVDLGEIARVASEQGGS